MDVCLLTCSAPFLIDEKVFPPLGLMAVGTSLKLQGHNVSILRHPNNSQYFGMGPTTSQYYDAVGELRHIKYLNKNSRVVIGGPHAEANAVECLEDGFDVVVKGDGERITIDTFHYNGVVNLERGELDTYPIIDRGLLDIHSYQYQIAGRKATTSLTTRGCPYHCGFCSKVENSVRYRSVENISGEIAYLQDTWGYNSVMFFDDTFITKKQRALDICHELKSRGMLWRCFVRGDLIVKHGRELTDEMSRCGCVEVGIGIESGSQRILDAIHKGETLDDISAAIFMLRESGIRVKGFFIVGLPGEDRESIEDTCRFINNVPLDDADFTVYQPYKGSPIWDNRKHHDISWNNLEGDRFYKGKPGGYKSLVSTSSLSSQEIVAARDMLEEKFRCQRLR